MKTFNLYFKIDEPSGIFNSLKTLLFFPITISTLFQHKILLSKLLKIASDSTIISKCFGLHVSESTIMNLHYTEGNDNGNPIILASPEKWKLYQVPPFSNPSSSSKVSSFFRNYISSTVSQSCGTTLLSIILSNEIIIGKLLAFTVINRNRFLKLKNLTIAQLTGYNKYISGNGILNDFIKISELLNSHLVFLKNSSLPTKQAVKISSQTVAYGYS
jgi:hypothetical protein